MQGLLCRMFCKSVRYSVCWAFWLMGLGLLGYYSRFRPGCGVSRYARWLGFGLHFLRTNLGQAPGELLRLPGGTNFNLTRTNQLFWGVIR